MLTSHTKAYSSPGSVV